MLRSVACHHRRWVATLQMVTGDLACFCGMTEDCRFDWFHRREHYNDRAARSTYVPLEGHNRPSVVRRGPENHASMSDSQLFASANAIGQGYLKHPCMAASGALYIVLPDP